MKKSFSNIFPVIIFLGLGFLISCSDKDPEPEPEPAKKLGIYLPTGSTMRNSYDNNIADSTQHHYDATGKLVRFLRSGGNSASLSINIIYDSDGRISQITGSNNGIIETREYNNQGNLQKIQRYDPDDATFKYGEQTFEYDANGKLSKMNTVGFDKYVGNPPFHTFNKFTCNADGLIILDSSFVAGASTTTGKPYYTDKTEYEYDNKKGVNEFGLNFNSGTFPFLYLFAPLRHNITSIKVTGKNGTFSQGSFIYEYNANGYPTKITSSSGGQPGLTKKITYQYF